jgi:YycE-like C-terminal domain
MVVCSVCLYIAFLGRTSASAARGVVRGLLAGSAAGPVMRSWAAGWAPAAAREWSSPGRGDRLPSWAQAPGRHTGQRTCPQVRCGGAVERAVRADGHLLPGHHRPAGPGDFPRQLSPGRDHPSSGCRAAGFTWRSSGLGRHRTRAAGLTSWVFCLPDAAARDQMQARLAAAGARPVAQIDYWQANGGVTYQDPDWREVVFASCTYVPSGS